MDISGSNTLTVSLPLKLSIFTDDDPDGAEERDSAREKQIQIEHGACCDLKRLFLFLFPFQISEREKEEIIKDGGLRIQGTREVMLFDRV